MKAIIRKYKSSDKKAVVRLMKEFCEYYWPINPYRKDGIDSELVARHHTNKMLSFTKKHEGNVLVVEENEEIIGFAGFEIKKQEYDDTLEDIPMALGHIGALFISNQYRGEGLGEKLLKTIEDYFKEKKCTHSTLEVYGFNPSHSFYIKNDYSDWNIEMIKTL